MADLHWDLPFFQNKLIPSSSDEDNPHLVSDDSDEDELFRKPFSDIIRDIGREEFDKEIRNVSFSNLIREESQESDSKEKDEELRKYSKTTSKDPKHHGRKLSIKNVERESLKKKHPSQTNDKAKALENVKVEEPPKNFRIEKNTFLAVKESLSIKTRRIISTPDGGTKRIPIEIFHIVPLTLPVDIQRRLKCESGVDLLLEQPWGIIAKSDVIALTEDTDSPFHEYAEQLQAYPEEEILIGRSDEINSSDFVVALTLAGRECLLEELKTKHQSIIDGIIKIKNFPIRPWTSLGSEKEIDESHVVNQRPFISYDCALRKDVHGKKPMLKFSHSEFYTEINEKPYQPIEMIRGIVMDKSIQACPSYNDMLVQTTPEIPVNSTTHFSIEMRVAENDEILKKMELDPEFLSSKVTTLFEMVDPCLTYNEDFDLYEDDYEALARAGKQLTIFPNLPYEFLSCMFTFLGTEHKGISSSSWHPNRPGVIAVSYSKNTIAMIGDLDGNSDEENLPDSDSDDENLFSNIVTRTPFDNVLEKVWLSQIGHMEKLQEQNKRNKSLYRLATTSLEFMKYARDMRSFQILQAKKQFLFKEDFEDLNKEEAFEYPLFEGTSKKYKNKKELNIDDILERRSKFLDRDYLFSDTFKWKLKGAESLNPIYMMIKEQKKLPKKYIRTFLFREIWAGDEWNFGSDLELKAIDINRDFREAGILALGMPLIPKIKLFLPGFTDDEVPDPTKEIPWMELENREQNTEINTQTLSSTDSEEDIGGDLFDNSPKCDVNLITLNLKGNRENSERLKSQAVELKDGKPRGDHPLPKIPHVTDAYLSNIPWGFNLETQDFLLKEIQDIATNESKLLFKNDIEVVSECSELDFWEKEDDIDDLDKLNLQHYVVIWTINDILRPLHRLSCPFEITAVSFCPHDGNIIAGGTETGQVVVWEVHDWSAKHIQQIKITDPDDEDGFQHLRKVMSWFKRLSKIEHIPVTSLSCKKLSHGDRVIDITWLPSNIQVSTVEGPIYKSSDPESDNTMQFMSTSADGTIMFWDMKGTPLPPLKASFSAWSLHRGKNFPVPDYLKKKPPLYGDLYLRWSPILKVSIAIPDSKVTAVRYHISCISPYEVTYKYKEHELEEKMYRVHIEENESLKAESLIGTIDGTVALITWQPTSEEAYGMKTGPDGIVINAKVLRTFNFVHDGPIIRIARHPKNRDIFLTAGGHVFALWTTERDSPLKWKKYSNLMTTFVGWTTYQASTFRIGFSNGTFEVWDLLEDGNNAKMSFPVGQGSICDFTIPRLPTTEGLVGIVDQKGLLKFYNVPKDYQIKNTTKDNTFFEKIEVENKRKQVTTQIADKVREQMAKDKETTAVKLQKDEEDEYEVEVKEETEEVQAKEVVGCKKYKEELYKWYIRRRGNVANWLDPAEKKWYNQEEEHMIQTILKNKKVSMDSLELALVPLKEKEKHEAELTVKKEEIATMADKIFRKAVQDLEVAHEEAYKSESVYDIEKTDTKIMEAAMEKVQKYFGASYLEEENNMEKWVKSQKSVDDLSFGDILLRNQKVRDFWNDRRRYLSKDQRWVREVIKEDLEKQGLKFSYWVNHEETYKVKKYKQRLKMIEKLKKVYGDDYDPFWDLDQSEETLKTEKITEKNLQMKDLLEKLLDILKDLDPSVKGLKKKLHKAKDNDLKDIDIELLRKMVKYYINFVKEGGIRLSTKRHRTFMDKITASLSGKDEIKVEIKIPEGSFYGKYAKDKGWVKPKRTVDVFGTPKFKFKYGDSYPQPSDEELAAPKVLCADFVKQIKGPTPSQLEKEEEEESEEEIRPVETTEITEAESQPESTEEKDAPEEKENIPEGKENDIEGHIEESVEQEDKDLPEEEVSKDKEETGSMEDEPRRKSTSVRFEKLDVKQEITETKSDDREKEAESGKETDDQEDEEIDMTEATKKQLDFSTLYEIIEEKKAKGEEILNIEDLSSYESIESLDSISSMADSPDHSICSDDWEPQRANYLVETEKDMKEYFEGPPPRYEPPRRRPYFRAPHEDEPTEEWTSDEKQSSEDFGKSYLGLKTEKQDKQPE